MAAVSMRIDEVSPTLIYIGESAVGASESDAIWRIKRITISGSLTKIEYAEGSAKWNSVWNDRASLIYS